MNWRNNGKPEASYEPSDSKTAYKTGFQVASSKDIKGKRYTRSIKSTITTLPGIQAQELIAPENPSIYARSWGASNNSTGYILSSELLQPTIQRPNLLGSRLPLRGTLGGVRSIQSTIIRDDCFVIRYSPDTKEIHLSKDTIGYFQPILDCITVARRTSASFLPVIQMDFEIVDLEKGIYSDIDTWYYDMDNDNKLTQGGIPANVLADALQVSTADLATACYLIFADTDMSILAFQLQLFYDNVFGLKDKLAQVNYTERGAWRRLCSYLSRSAVQKPLQTLANILKSKQCAVTSGNYFSIGDWTLARPQFRSKSALDPIQHNVIARPIINSFKYVISDGSVQNLTRFGRIISSYEEETNALDPMSVLTNDSFMEFPHYNVAQNATLTYRVSNYVGDFRYWYELVSAGKVNELIKYVDNFIARVNHVVNTVPTKYASVRAFMIGTNTALKLAETPLPLEIHRNDVAYPVNDFVTAVSQMSIANYSEVSYQNSEALTKDSKVGIWTYAIDYMLGNLPNVQGANAYTVSLRVPVNYKGQYPTIVNNEQFPSSLQMIRDQFYVDNYAGGLVHMHSSFFTYDMYYFTATYAGGGQYADNYLKFLDYLRNRTLFFSYSIVNGPVSTTISVRPSEVMLEDILVSAPSVQQVYERGIASSIAAVVEAIV